MPRLPTLRLLGASVLLGLLAMAPAGAFFESPTPMTRPPAQGGYSVCPLYCFMVYQTYASYYAVKCPLSAPPEYVQLDAAKGLKACFCEAECMDQCVPFAGLKGKSKSFAHRDLAIRSGLKEKLPPPANPIPAASRRFTRLLGTPVLAALYPQKDSKNPVTVALYLARINPDHDGKKGPARIFGFGFEVSSPDEPELTIPYTDLSDIEGKCCTATVGSVSYSVVLHEGTPLEDGKQPDKKKP